MDPEQLMRDIITDYDVWRNPSTPDRAANLCAITILEHVGNLHDWIGKGGFVPTSYGQLNPILKDLEEWYSGACSQPQDHDGQGEHEDCTDAWGPDEVAAWKAENAYFNGTDCE